MSATATRPDTSYLLRKLHSLTGILPVGAFLANISGPTAPRWWERAIRRDFSDIADHSVSYLCRMGFHLFADPVSRRLRGVHLAAWESNVSEYPWVRNWLFTLQRYTGLIAFGYIGWHLYTERWLTHGTSTYARWLAICRIRGIWRFCLSAYWPLRFTLELASGIFFANGALRRRCARNAPPDSWACLLESPLASLAY